MILETDIKDNWILDRDYSDRSEHFYDKKVILDALNSQIDVRTRSLSTENTLFVKKDSCSFNLQNFFGTNTPKYKNYISKSQNWLGHIIEITNENFTAKLIDKNNPTTYEIAQFDIDEVSKGDLTLLKLGALFYWSVGYANQNGQVIKQSLIRFKRALEFSNEEFDSIVDSSDELNNTLTWE